MKTQSNSSTRISTVFITIAALAVTMRSEVAMADEKLIEAKGPQGPLVGAIAGTLDGTMPIVLIIPGSGPTDRDGNNPAGILAAPYRLLAEGLAGKGVASVRIDKRGMFGSQSAVADANTITLNDYAGDVGSWIAEIQKTNGGKCVWVAGHSEGGLVAILAASKLDTICGLVLLAVPGRPLNEVLIEQLEATPAAKPSMPRALAAIKDMKAGKRHDTKDMDPQLLPLFADEVQGFVISLMTFKAAETFAKVDLPALIVQGGKDMQVTMADGEALKAANPQATLYPAPNASHVLKDVKGDGVEANMATYADPNMPLASGIVDTVSSFILKGGK
jgi:uncharacterized protein